MAKEHTPGPWTTEGRYILYGEKNDWLATVERFHGEYEAESQANARLIAAAPELLEALKGILEIGKRNMENPKYDGYFNTARAAIARAEGNEPEEHTSEPEIKPIATYKGFEIFDSGGGKLNAYDKKNGMTVTGYSLGEVNAIIDRMTEEHTGEPDPSDLYREWKDAQDDADQPTAYDP